MKTEGLLKKLFNRTNCWDYKKERNKKDYITARLTS